MKNAVLILMLPVFVLLLGATPSRGISTDANNVVIVLDSSGSMNAMMKGASIQKMAAAKNALIRVMEQIPENTNVGLLVFGSSNLKNDWVYPLGPLDKVTLEEAINRPRPQGETPLGEYIKKGADRLLKQREAQFGYGTYRLLIVTDGEAQDQKLVNRYAPEVIARGITMDVIGVDMQKQHTLATRVHSYRRADDPESLALALIDVFAEVGGSGKDTAGDDAFAEISGIPDATAKAMLKALASSGNQPIGSVRMDVSDPHPPSHAAPQKKAVVKSFPAPQKDNGGISGWAIYVIAAIVAAMIIGNKLRRRRR